MIKALFALFTSLPELLKLIKFLQDEAAISIENRKVKKDIKKIRQAFQERDEDALKKLFTNSIDHDDDDWVSHVG